MRSNGGPGSIPMSTPIQRQNPSEAQSAPSGQGGASALPLLAFLWRHPRAILLGTLAALVLYGGLALLARVVFPGTTVASLGLRFPFEGVDEGKYPNGLRFSPQDLLAPAVLERVYGENDLGGAEDFDHFKTAFFITQSNQAREELRAEYAVKLRDSRLSAAERRELEEDFAARLKGLQTNTFRLAWESRSPIALAPAQVEKVLLDIPATWARLAEERRGVLGYDLALASALSGAQASPAADPLLTGELLRRNVENLSTMAAALAELPGASLVRGSGGETVIDLGEQVSAFSEVVVVPAVLTGVKLARGNSPQATDEALRYRRETLKRALEGAQHRARELEGNYYAYVSQSGSGQSARPADAVPVGGQAGLSAGGAAMLPGAGMIAQVGGGVIDELIELRERTQDVVYRQKLNDDVRAAKLRAVQAAETLSFLELLQQEAQAPTQASPAVSAEEFAERVTAAQSQLTDFASRLKAFYDEISARNLRPEAGLYVIDEPFWVERSPVLSLVRIILGAVAVATLAMLAIVAVCALREARSSG